MNELISVIINVYNGERFIRKCLDSVINQTYKNLEILIINDGSTDNSLSICKSYKDSRIKIISTENRGLALARNVGIDNASGQYLYFIDMDDCIDFDTIEYLYNLSKRYETKITTCRSVIVYDYDFTSKQKKEKTYVITPEKMLKDILLLKERQVTVWNKLIDRELFENLRFENRIIEDIVFTYKLVMKTDKIGYSNQVKYYYLKHDGSITAIKDNLEKSIDTYNGLLERYYNIEKVYPMMIENNVCMLQLIIRLYLKNDKKLLNFLEEKKALELYNRLFSFKIVKCDIGIREKIKIILFRINPKLCKFSIKLYLKIKKWWSR